MLVVGDAAVAEFGAAGGDFDFKDAGALHLGLCGGLAGCLPAVGDDAVCDELHGVGLFGVVLDEGGVAEEDDGAVVVGVVEGGGGEDEGVDVGGCDADGEALLLLLVVTFGIVFVRSTSDVHHAGGDVAVEVEVQWVAEVRAGAVEGAHVADHGEGGGEGGVWGVEGDVEELGGVDEVVDGFEGVDCALVVAADGVVLCFGVF